MKQNSDNQFKIFKIIHIINLIIWSVLGFSSGGHIEDCYNKLFGNYLGYSIFEALVFAYMFGSAILLAVLYKFLKSWAFLLVEGMLIMIVIIYWRIFLCQS